MGEHTNIEWADATWNPVVGCTKVSPGCDNCYAETFVNRFAGKNSGFPNRFDVVTMRGDRTMLLPLSGKWQARPLKIFVNSLSDLFHDDVPAWFIARVLAVMAATPQHTYQLLTKRHGRMRSLLNSDAFRSLVAVQMAALQELLRQQRAPRPALVPQLSVWPLPNLWLLVSVEDQKRAELRIPALQATDAAVRGVSFEPLLGPIDAQDRGLLTGIDWAIVGGESGPGARPMHPDWARSLRDQCTAAGVAFLFKQWGAWRWAAEVDDIEAERALKASGQPDPFATRSCYTVSLDGSYSNTEAPRAGNATMMRVGKKRSGRTLDGRTWDQFPEVAA
jgi:protein gp37